MLCFERVAPLPPVTPGHVVVRRSVSSDGRALRLCVPEAAAPGVLGRRDTGGASFPDALADAAAPFRLLVSGAGGDEEIVTPPLSLAHPMAEIFPDGRVLIAAARSRWRGPGDADLNGAVIDPRAGTSRRILLGDGISDIGIDGEGRIWIGYFDEGVFGNFGWNGPGPAGPAAGGLVAMDDAGTVLFSLNDADAGVFVVDCYALDASRSRVWAYHYTDFGLVRLDGRLEPEIVPPLPISGSGAVAVGRDAILLSGGYGDERGVFHRVPRGGPGRGRARRLRGVLPDGLSFEGLELVGRGGVMHALGDLGWFAAAA